MRDKVQISVCVHLVSPLFAWPCLLTLPCTVITLFWTMTKLQIREKQDRNGQTRTEKTVINHDRTELN
jgi:hypothetical protein